ncbi:MAG TPA: zinc-dependent alcohol dehydrogenase family protein [Nocardioides sp.]|uniref:zinc-dependent alcohol dehydrogenase family protein n=1 Tax=Nocardioides sp. TaxID=35761 RepID=UPI002E313D87|nr:zinc-dependent alcohol dehydrogenase family protein [Nocardioides sp.]HEX5086425.1 zinc-dependent alcohol dehydrogenase family protein [Nocardioides sp.]
METGPPMRAWAVRSPGPVATAPLVEERRVVPRPAPDEVLIRVSACGLCRTDLHLAEGDLAPRRPATVPGHQAVGRVVGSGSRQQRFEQGDRVGVAWLRGTCGHCRWCRSGAENLCPDSAYTGWDADGGFAEYAVVPAAFAYRLPEGPPDTSLAPLLCAGIIGYRALRRAQLPPGGRLGLYGFGSSAHITAQVARAQGAELFVVTRGDRGAALAAELGAAWSGAPGEVPPVPLDSAIVFAPAGELVPEALGAVGRGGTVALAGIHMTDVPGFDYDRHLFLEKTLTSVTANTRADGEELLRLAPRVGVDVRVTEYPFDAVDRALADLAHDRLAGSAVITGYPAGD